MTRPSPAPERETRPTRPRPWRLHGRREAAGEVVGDRGPPRLGVGARAAQRASELPVPRDEHVVDLLGLEPPSPSGPDEAEGAAHGHLAVGGPEGPADVVGLLAHAVGEPGPVTPADHEADTVLPTRGEVDPPEVGPGGEHLLPGHGVEDRRDALLAGCTVLPRGGVTGLVGAPEQAFDAPKQGRAPATRRTAGGLEGAPPPALLAGRPATPAARRARGGRGLGAGDAHDRAPRAVPDGSCAHRELGAAHPAGVVVGETPDLRIPHGITLCPNRDTLRSRGGNGGGVRQDARR